MPSGLSDVEISDRLSDINRRRITGASNLQVSWELSAAGMLSFEVTKRDLVRAGLDPRNLLSKWIRYEHPTAGPWGGIITTVNPADGVISVSAESWAAALRGSVTPEIRIGDGNVIRTLSFVIDSVSSKTGIRAGPSQTDGREVHADTSFFERGQDIYEGFLPAVVDEWYAAFGGTAPSLQAAGWNVDPTTRVFTFDASWGRDLSATVVLADGLHNTSSEWDDDVLDIANVIYLNAEANYQYSQTRMVRRRRGKKPKAVTSVASGTAEYTAIATNLSSTHQHGDRVLVVQEDTLYPSPEALLQAAVERAKYLSRDQQLVRIDCADVNGVWASFREGDIVTADLANSGAKGKMVVRHRALDVGRGVMTVSGEAEMV